MRCYRFTAWLALLLVAVTGCYPQAGTGPPAAILRPVTVLELQHESVAETLTLIGTIEPWQEVILYFEVPGVVAEVFVEEGRLVKLNDPIARLVPDDYDLAVAQAQEELKAAQARANLLHAGTREEDLRAAQADNARASVRAAYWASELRRTKTLFEKNAISASELGRVQREHDAADQEERLTKAQLERAVAGPRKEEIEAADAEVQARTQASALAKRQWEKATLRAPFAGRVEKRLLDVGAYVNVFPTGGVPVAHLVDLDKVDAVIAVPETLLPRFADKPRVEIVSAVDPRIRAESEVIERIAVGQVADRASGTYELRVRISNPDHRFTSGMVVIAETTGGASRRAIRVPLTALCRAYGQPPYVLLVEPDSAQVVAREVELGPIAGEQVEVSHGLSGGELLIVRGQDRVVVGDRVKYQRAKPASAARTEGPVP